MWFTDAEAALIRDIRALEDQADAGLQPMIDRAKSVLWLLQGLIGISAMHVVVGNKEKAS